MKRKITLADAVNNKKEEEKNEKLEQLNVAINEIAEVEQTYKTMDKMITNNKNLIKNLCLELNLDEYTSSSGKRITISHIDKSFMEPATTLDYLRNNGFEKFIKVKEYFDESELTMAIVNGELKAEDLAPFMVNKEEIRLNLKS